MLFFFLQLSPSWTTGDPGTNNSNKLERVFTTLLRDAHSSLGFSISGGKGADPFIEGDSSVYISKVAESGPAHRDGKIQVGDKVVQVRIHCNIKVDYHYNIIIVVSSISRIFFLLFSRLMV